MYRFYFDFSATYVGVGMICPYIINVSVLLGGILSWGIMWPLIETRKGHWYSNDLDQSSFHGLQGYKVRFPLSWKNCIPYCDMPFLYIFLIKAFALC